MNGTNGPRYRTWQFLHATAEALDQVSGLQVNVRGGISMVEGEEAVRQAIFLLLSTVPGERVMRPTYGCHLHRLVFAPNDDTTAGLAIHYVRSALDRWEPRIEVVQLDASRSDEAPERLNLLLEYRLKTSQRVQLLTYSFSLAGEKI
jgi:phage baseplate assembly protein W